MAQYKDVEVGSVVYFWFAANTTAGSAGDGATPLYDVRLAGAAANAAPTASGTPTLLTHANYTDGLHEIAIDTTGYAAGEYAVFCTLTISSVNPAGFCGSFKVVPVGDSVSSAAARVMDVTDADSVLLDGTQKGAIADAVWDENLAAHDTEDSVGNVLNDLTTESGGGVYQLATDAVPNVVNKTVGYQDAAVWIDTVNGTAGTTSYVNGTADKPVSNLANALTIASAVGLRSLRLSPDSSITLTASVAGWDIRGGTVALGGQTTTGARFEDCTLSGTMSGAATFVRCTLNAITGLIGTCLHCGLANNSTLAAGNSFFAWCYASRVSAGIPTYTFSAGSSSVVFRGYAGGLTAASLTSDHELRYDAVSGGLTLAASCTGGTLVIRGLVRLTDNSGGAVTITQGYGTTVSTDSSGRAYADVQLIEAADATDAITAAVPTAAQVAAAVVALDLVAGAVDYEDIMATSPTLGAMIAAIRAQAIGKLTAPTSTSKRWFGADGSTHYIEQTHASNYTTREVPTQEP